MILVDTSVWIDFFSGNESILTESLSDLINSNVPFGINVFIYQELLQGTPSEKEFKKLKEYLDTQIFYTLHGGNESYTNAAKIYFKCRRKGITIRSTIDCAIAQTAIENKLYLMHNDKDFDDMKRAIGDLKIYKT